MTNLPQAQQSEPSSLQQKVQQALNQSEIPVSPERAESTVVQMPASSPDGYWQQRWQLLRQPGLSLKQRLRLIPGVGYGMAWLNALLRLPLSRHETAVTLTLLQQQIDSLKLQLQQQQQALLELQNLKLGARLERYDALDIGTRLMELDKLQIGRRLKSSQLALKTSLLNEAKLLQKFNIDGGSAASETAAPAQADFMRDQFYVEFEALFRGSMAEIKQRMTVYLPYLKHVTSLPRDQRLPVVDVGCGRGEWLELLNENDIPAMGVDMNQAMVKVCVERGLLVRCADAIAYLRELPAGSVSAVTGFQIIEHLPFPVFVELLEAALHALCPGGIVIFETPNPENLKVGACNFYFDPTHLHPIIPQVAEFTAKQRGYSKAEILRLHPYPDELLVQGDSDIARVINKEFYGPQDYALIAWK